MAGKQFHYAVRTAATLYTAHSYRYTVQFTVQFAATQGGSDDGSSQSASRGPSAVAEPLRIIDISSVQADNVPR